MHRFVPESHIGAPTAQTAAEAIGAAIGPDERAHTTSDAKLAAAYAMLRDAWKERDEALVVLGCDTGADTDIVTEARRWARTMGEVRQILGARDGEDVREAARRAKLAKE